MRYGRLVAVAVCLVSLAACSVNPSKMDDASAREIVKKLTYVRDVGADICYAAVAAIKSGESDQIGFTITWVPCTPEVMAKITPPPSNAR